MQKTISILGSTGSVGRNSIDIVKKFANKDFQVISLVGGSNYKLLCKQAIELKVKYVAIADEKCFKDLKSALSSYNIRVIAGERGIQEVCSLKTDITIAAISGFAGLVPLSQSITNSSNIILANKESMVCAGRILLESVKKYNTKIIPVDSEHNAIFQVFDRNNRAAIDSITLTCSGGPFRGYSIADLQSVNVSKALEHPKWKMGKKITIDSATLFNKGLEVIEAHYLFNIPIDQIKVVVHKDSIVHGLVQYKDGSILAQMGRTDMRIPICHALYYPKRYQDTKALASLNLTNMGQLTFEEVDNIVFPSIELCRTAYKQGEHSLILLNASNEIAVQYFLEKKIKFLDIFKIVSTLLERQVFAKRKITSIEEILLLDKEYRAKTKEFIQKTF